MSTNRIDELKKLITGGGYFVLCVLERAAYDTLGDKSREGLLFSRNLMDILSTGSSEVWENAKAEVLKKGETILNLIKKIRIACEKLDTCKAKGDKFSSLITQTYGRSIPISKAFYTDGKGEVKSFTKSKCNITRRGELLEILSLELDKTLNDDEFKMAVKVNKIVQLCKNEKTADQHNAQTKKLIRDSFLSYKEQVGSDIDALIRSVVHEKENVEAMTSFRKGAFDVYLKEENIIIEENARSYIITLPDLKYCKEYVVKTEKATHKRNLLASEKTSNKGSDMRRIYVNKSYGAIENISALRTADDVRLLIEAYEKMNGRKFNSNKLVMLSCERKNDNVAIRRHIAGGVMAHILGGLEKVNEDVYEKVEREVFESKDKRRHDVESMWVVTAARLLVVYPGPEFRKEQPKASTY